jgi:hypothetical protein
MLFDIDAASIIKSHNSFGTSQSISTDKTTISHCITIDTATIIEIGHIVIHWLDLYFVDIGFNSMDD